MISGRKEDQGARRHSEILNSAVSDRLCHWTPEEDQYLTTKVCELGHAWAAIAANLPGRPPLTCRNRWRKLQKALFRQAHRGVAAAVAARSSTATGSSSPPDDFSDDSDDADNDSFSSLDAAPESNPPARRGGFPSQVLAPAAAPSPPTDPGRLSVFPNASSLPSFDQSAYPPGDQAAALDMMTASSPAMTVDSLGMPLHLSPPLSSTGPLPSSNYRHSLVPFIPQGAAPNQHLGPWTTTLSSTSVANSMPIMQHFNTLGSGMAAPTGMVPALFPTSWPGGLAGNQSDQRAVSGYPQTTRQSAANHQHHHHHHHIYHHHYHHYN
ncbi:hypothetical protein ASPZODRAFT_20647 [Penicilliopsis zonata CBS 506.65]|uniref:Uncharacterized protein n=1 Tax=Penicilliopsis zonata CBS 506.65 TaxID=1073090 RepID=A0A1L9S525_9EURO|nr:hypothetical protein ASPZODRAFT_20647 [Penicilliopsis zonata CBS 506.65]OJJ42254.1 hypothetical protein ASPZODRAFT_20647 [Penicilliopsis zonata CBS 506.65]